MRQLEERFGESIKALLRRLYWDEELSLAQVAKRVGPVSGPWPKKNQTPERLLHRSTIRDWMKAFKIPRRKIARAHALHYAKR